MQDIFNWKIGGEVGNGIISAGLICSKVFAAGGYNIFDYTEYTSLIKGGHNSYSIAVSKTIVRSSRIGIDLLIALNDETISLHSSDLNYNACVIYDPSKCILAVNNPEWKSKNILPIPIPLYDIVKKMNVESIMINIVAIGASLAIVDYDLEILDYVLENTFKHKGKKVIFHNQDVAKAGYFYVKNSFKEKFKLSLPVLKRSKQIILTGNEATALGAIRGGCKLYCAYPMTPASPFLHFLAAYEAKYNIVVKQTEDEIAAINMAIGGSFTGVRSMVGTSGAGFSLMVEGLGLAAETEIPVVVYLGQRGGPSTGLPTWTEQGDLQFAIHASQGEFPRIVLAPGDIEEFFQETVKAFNFAEKYQLPVILMSDRYIAESHQNLANLDFNDVHVYKSNEIIPEGEYKRYLVTQNGISPRSIPTMKGKHYLANSDEHDENGISNETKENRISQMDKRSRKLITALVDIPLPKIFTSMDGKPEISFVSWGSNKGVILDTLGILKSQGIASNLMHIIYLNPFPGDVVKKFIEDGKVVILVECNKSGQLGRLIKENTGIDFHHKILKYDGRPIFTEELVNMTLAIYKRWQA